MDRLRDKVILITGAAGGIGSVCVERYIAEGAQVVAADLSEERVYQLAERLGSKVVPMRLDIGDEASFKSVIDETVKRFGKLDVLFNNAALTDAAAQNNDTTVTDVPIDLWTRTLHVNVTGCMFGCRHAIPHMAASGGGSIINASSTAALGGDLVRTAYGTSKAAVAAFTQYVAVQYGRQGIRCNAIAPGPIVTEHFRQVAPELEALLQRHTPTPELGRPEDIAMLTIYLASDESRYLTGQMIAIDGGLTSHLGHTADFQDYMNKLAPAK